MRIDYSLKRRQGGPEQGDDESDIELRTVTEKYTIAHNVPDWLAYQICALPDLPTALRAIRNDCAEVAAGREPASPEFWAAVIGRADRAIAKTEGVML